jgi:UPF0755 protein
MTDNGDKYDEFGYIPEDELELAPSTVGAGRVRSHVERPAEHVADYLAEDDQDDVDDADDYVLLPPPTNWLRKLAVTAVTLIAVFGIIAAASIVWVARQITPPGPQGDEIASLEIPANTTFTGVAELLEREGVISNASVLVWYRQLASINSVKAGRYVGFRKNSSMADAVKVLNKGPVPSQNVVLTIIPGTLLADALKKITTVFPAFSFDQLSLTLASGAVKSRYHPDPTVAWEGYLLPETYQFEADATPEEVLQKIVDEFDDTLDSLNYRNAAAVTGRTAQELVTIASMIEREAGDPVEERAKIARVIFNRLETKMTLGIDATILYGLGRRGNEKPLTKSELETDSPYNSRTRQGLPPTAISLPSRDSLEAAMNPLEGPWTFYVLVNNSPREHFFTDSIDEFNKAKATCQSKGLC